MTFAKTLIERLKTGPFTAELDFGYYTEDMKLTLLDDGQLKVELEVPSYAEYENGTHTYEEIVSVQAFEEFLSNRLAGDMTKLSINGKKVQGVDLVADFARSLRFDAHEALARQAEAILREAELIADEKLSEAYELEVGDIEHLHSVVFAIEYLRSEASSGRISGDNPEEIVERGFALKPRYNGDEATAKEVLAIVKEAKNNLKNNA